MAWLAPASSLCAPLLTTQPRHLQPKLVEAAALEGESVTKVAAGARHTLVLCASGNAFAFGWGAFGQLGSGSYASSALPVAVAVPAGAKVADLAAGWWHSLFLTP
jgi:alpha-tubulin suppressor-like RCC1 family protein